MSTPGDPHDPTLPPPSDPDPNFVPATAFASPSTRPQCTCPGITDDPDCLRHGTESAR